MGYVSEWLHQHHLAPTGLHPDWAEVVDLLKTSWLTILLVALGAVAVVSAILIAWPVLAHIASRFFL